MNYRYAIVTPVKNEERIFGEMVASVARQTVPPKKWIIVDDGSTDRTGEIIRQAASSHDWIIGVECGVSTDRRKPGGEAVLEHGIHRLDLAEYDFFARLDGDISFEPDYFENLIQEFEINPRLGIGGGVCYVWRKGGLVEEKNPKFHVRGAVKTYRVGCFREIGGLESELGWDMVDEIRANMLGWQTMSFPHLKVIHHRPTHTSSGVLRGKMHSGMARYFAGYHPLFMLASTVKNMAHPPYLLGGFSMLFGFLSGYLKSFPQIRDQELIRYIREQQWNRLTGRNTIWK
jgi:glycosyltransferase involved in cell wall biosynthesis